jgi:hypothetical protein
MPVSRRHAPLLGCQEGLGLGHEGTEIASVLPFLPRPNIHRLRQWTVLSEALQDMKSGRGVIMVIGWQRGSRGFSTQISRAFWRFSPSNSMGVHGEMR